MSVQTFVSVHFVIVEIFYWISENTQLVVPGEITKVIKINPLGTMNVCGKFHGNSSNSGELIDMPAVEPNC